MPKRVTLLLSLLMLTACHKRPQVVPALKAHSCPKNSIEFNRANYCTDPPRCEHTVPVAQGDLCMALDPVTKEPIGVFLKGDSCNPFTEQDCDAPDVGKKGKKRDKD